MPNEVHVIEGPQGFALICAGDPNGAIRAPIGTLAIDNVTPTIWQNTNGVTTWVQVGGGGSSGFPVGPLNDGTYTYEIVAGVVPGEQTASTVDDATGNFGGTVTPGSTGTAGFGRISGNSTSFTAILDANADETNHGYIRVNTNDGTFWMKPVAGDPNGTVNGVKGSLGIDVTTPALWQNTDGATAWAKFTGSTAVTGLYATPSTTTLPNGVSTPMTWPAHNSGAVLLDLTTPTAPTVLTAGTYTFDVFLTQIAGFPAELVVDAGVGPLAVTGTSVVTGQDAASVSLTAVLPAGAPLSALMTQNSGGASSARIASATITKM